MRCPCLYHSIGDVGQATGYVALDHRGHICLRVTQRTCDVYVWTLVDIQMCGLGLRTLRRMELGIRKCPNEYC